MKKHLVFVFILFNACVPSIHPLYHVEDLVSEDRILGKWGQKEDPGEAWDVREAWTFEKLPGKKNFLGTESKESVYPGYLLTIDEGNAPAKFEARILQLDGQLFMDMYPWNEYNYNQIEEIENDWLKMHLYPVHTFARIRFEGESLIIEPFNPDFITDLLERNKIRISHEEVDGSFILTAGTDELQKFVIKFGREQEAYIDPGVFSKL